MGNGKRFQASTLCHSLLLQSQTESVDARQSLVLSGHCFRSEYRCCSLLCLPVSSSCFLCSPPWLCYSPRGPISARVTTTHSAISHKSCLSIILLRWVHLASSTSPGSEGCLTVVTPYRVVITITIFWKSSPLRSARMSRLNVFCWQRSDVID